MKTILVVEDNIPVREVLRCRLEHSGYLVTSADTARHALASLDHFMPDLVVLHLGLPDMTSLELLRT